MNNELLTREIIETWEFIEAALDEQSPKMNEYIQKMNVLIAMQKNREK